MKRGVVVARNVAELVELHLQRVAPGLSPLTVAARRLSLSQLSSWLLSRGLRDIRQLTPEVLRTYPVFLRAYRYRRSGAEDDNWEALAPATVYARLGHVAAFLAWLATERVLVVDLSGVIERRSPGKRLPKGVLSEDEARAILTAPDPTSPLGLRDRAVLELLYSSGLRIGEVRALDLVDLDLTDGLVFVRSGKGSKDRYVPLGKAACEALIRYLEDGRPHLAKSPGQTALFLSSKQGGNLGRRLTEEQIGNRLRQAVRDAGVTHHVTAHTFRHTMATHLLRAGAGVRHVQEMLGHAHLVTTETYTHVAIADVRRAHARSHPRGRPSVAAPKLTQPKPKPRSRS